MWRATIAVFLLAALASLYLLSRAGWALGVITVLSILCGIGYTAGKKSLAYLGIADLFVVVFFGPVAVAGTHLVQARAFSWIPVLAGLSPGLIATGLLIINNLRDVEEDRLANKRTPAVRFGRTFVRVEYTVVMFLAAVIPALLVWRKSLPMPVLLTGLFWLAALPVIRKAWMLEGPALNALMGSTGRLLLLFVALFCAGLWL
jgi:1,4-dihydroxy-2-naphthoate octaprenyltransferase